MNTMSLTPPHVVTPHIEEGGGNVINMEEFDPTSLELEINFLRLFLQRHEKGSESNNVGAAVEEEIITASTTVQGQGQGQVKEHKHKQKHVLNRYEKIQLCRSLIGDIQNDRMEEQRLHEVKSDEHRIALSELQLRLNDLERDAFAFKRDVILGGAADENTSTNKNTNTNTNTNQRRADNRDGGTNEHPLLKSSSSSSSSKPKHQNQIQITDQSQKDRGAKLLLRYHQSRLLSLESTLGRLKLERTEQKRNVHKLNLQLHQMQQDGTMNISFLDYHQLQIDNKKRAATLVQNNEILVKLKLMESRMGKKLIKLVERVKELDDERDRVEKAVVMRQKHLNRLNDQIVNYEREGAKYEDSSNGSDGENKQGPTSGVTTENQCTRSEELSPSSSSSPSSGPVELMDIIQHMGDLHKLKNDIKTWQRKVQIAEGKKRTTLRSSSQRT